MLAVIGPGVSHRRMGLALLAVAVTAILCASAGPALAHEDEEEPIPADTGDTLDPVAEVPAGAGRIIGSPEAGPKPQHSGDRGGRLQFVTMAATGAAVGFIMWRIARAARRAAARSAAQNSP